jgi:hypothetical protein
MGTLAEVERNLRAFQIIMDQTLLNAVRLQMEPELDFIWPSGRVENHG